MLRAGGGQLALEVFEAARDRVALRRRRRELSIADGAALVVLYDLRLQLGLAKRGEGVHFFNEGRSTPGGSLPINTNGGGLSYTHTGMYGIFPIIEATRQLRGECGPRQVPGAHTSLVNGMGGMLSAAGTLVLSNEA